jgi:hypothetical protein
VVRIPEGPSNSENTVREEGDRLTDIIEQAMGCRSIARKSELCPLINEKDNMSVVTFDETLESICSNTKSGSSGLKIRVSKPMKPSSRNQSVLPIDIRRKKTSSVVESNTIVLRYFFSFAVCAFVIATTYYNYSIIQRPRTPLQHNHQDDQLTTAKMKTLQQALPQKRGLNKTEFQQLSESVMEYSHEFQKQATSSSNMDVVYDTDPPEDRPASPQTTPVSTRAFETPQVSDIHLLSGYKDTWDEHEETDIPVFWHIPKSGGLIVKDIMVTCHRMILAQEAISLEGHAEGDVSFS